MRFIIIIDIYNLTVKFIDNKVFLVYGVPKELVSDRGKQFDSIAFQSMLDKYHVIWRPTTAYHSQSNPTEAVNKPIGRSIRAYIKNDTTHKKWDIHLPEIICALNTLKHSTTQKSPFEVLYGRPMKLSGELHDLPINCSWTA